MSLDGGRGIGALVRDLVDESITLVRSEIRIAKVEFGEMVHGFGLGTALVGMGAVFALLGGLSLLVGVVLLIGDQWLPADRYWLAALIVLVLSGAIAAWFAQRGAALIWPARPLLTETETTLSEDAEWLKQRLTSGATSS